MHFDKANIPQYIQSVKMFLIVMCYNMQQHSFKQTLLFHFILTSKSQDLFLRLVELNNCLRVQAWGMGDNSIFSVFSNIWSSAHLKIPSFLATQIVYIGYGQFKKMTPFPFTFLQLCSMCFYILLLLIKVCYYYILVPIKQSLKYLFPEKITIEICCQNCQECNTFCVTTFFSTD